MNLSQRVTQQLEQFTTHGAAAVEAAVVETRGVQATIVGLPAEGEEPSVGLTIADADRYSVILLNLEVNYGQPAPSSNLQGYADQAIQRLTYLEEPLVLVELDEEDNLAQLRSQVDEPPTGPITYWEVLIWDQPHLRATLARYGWSPDKPEREAIPYPATFTQAARMAEDLAVSLKNVEK